MALLKNISHDEVLALYRQYESGDSLTVIGGRLNTSHETVRLLFREHGLPLYSSAERTAQRQAAHRQRLEELREEIVELYKRYGEIGQVMRHLPDPPPPRKLVSEVIASIPNREGYRRRGVLSMRPRAELIADIQRAAKAKGEPLTSTAYRQAASELKLAAYNTQVRAFGTFAAGLEAAGVQSNKARGKRSYSFTEADCIFAVAQCIREHGGIRVSYERYCEWAGDPEVPSGPTIRNLLGWNHAVELALAM